MLFSEPVVVIHVRNKNVLLPLPLASVTSSSVNKESWPDSSTIRRLMTVQIASSREFHTFSQILFMFESYFTAL